MKKKTSTSFRLSEEAKNKLARLAEFFGISQASVLEVLIRQKITQELGKSFKGQRGD